MRHRRIRRIVVDESERGAVVPDWMLDDRSFKGLASAVMEVALRDLQTWKYRGPARRFLTHDFPEGHWNDFLNIRPAMLRALVNTMCATPPRMKGH